MAEHQEDDFALISIAVEHRGAEAARPYLEAAGAAFPTLVDDRGVSVTAFGFTVVPNGILVDEEGIVRYVNQGAFSIDHREDVAAVERFLAGAEPAGGDDGEIPIALGASEQALVAARIRLGRLLAEQGRPAEAAAEWRAALRLDPENFVIRKQIWAVEHPEKFYPTIDFDWQEIQLRAEREAEIAAGVRGPDGCPMPIARLATT